MAITLPSSLPLRPFRRRRSHQSAEPGVEAGSNVLIDPLTRSPTTLSGRRAEDGISTTNAPIADRDEDEDEIRMRMDAPSSSRSRSRAPSLTGSNDSVMALFKADYVSMRMYVKEMDYRQALRKALRRHMYKWYAILVVAVVLTALITSKHETIVEFCEPVTRTIRGWPGGWVVPIAILIIVSFPPLVGHEIIGILCGLVYGLWVGFAILAAGTFLGEIATWIAFKWCCQGRAAKFEKKNKLYASLTQLIREKSFMFTLVLRFSAVPGHIVTAVSASAGANFWMYLAAAFLTLPKQWTIVYLGQAFGTKSRKNTIISICTTVLTLIGTVVAAFYIYYQMRIVMRRNALSLPTLAEENSTDIMIESGFIDEKRDINAPGSSNLHARRPWLATRGSTFLGVDEGENGMRTPTRSWSMPGHMNEEELREWVEEIKYEQSTNAIANSGGREQKTPAIRIDGDGPATETFTYLPPVFSPSLEESSESKGMISASVSGRSTPYLVEPDSLLPLSSTLTSTANSSVLDLSPPTYPPTPSKRGESSVSRPSSRAEGSSTQAPRRLGGREIADDADAYAISRGARRPDYGRMRGDSRAALLGRPVDDATLDMGGASWKRDYTRSRGDSGAALIGRPNMTSQETDDGLGKAIESWKRDYGNGRSRAESGAALTGRPRGADGVLPNLETGVAAGSHA